MGWYKNQKARYEAAQALKADADTVHILTFQGSPKANARDMAKAIREQAALGYTLTNQSANAGRGFLAAKQVVTATFQRAVVASGTP
jgi:hypothetical protein